MTEAALAAAPLLALSDVDTYYGDSHILHGVSLTVQPGEIVALLGRNGVGKTTTIQTILGLPPPQRGDIRFRGEVISGRPTYEIVQQGIGWVPQGHRIFPDAVDRRRISNSPLPRRDPAAGRSTTPMNCFHACRADATPAAIRSPAASSRCSRSRAHWCRTPIYC